MMSCFFNCVGSACGKNTIYEYFLEMLTRQLFSFSYFTVMSLLSITYAEISVTTHYESNYKEGSKSYILNGESVTLVCDYGRREDQVYDVKWYDSDGSNNVVLFSKAVADGSEVQGTPLEDRDVTWTYTDTSHKLTIPQINIFTDAIRYRCYILSNSLESGNAYLQLNDEIYGGLAYYLNSSIILNFKWVFKTCNVDKIIHSH